MIITFWLISEWGSQDCFKQPEELSPDGIEDERGEVEEEGGAGGRGQIQDGQGGAGQDRQGVPGQGSGVAKGEAGT